MPRATKTRRFARIRPYLLWLLPLLASSPLVHAQGEAVADPTVYEGYHISLRTALRYPHSVHTLNLVDPKIRTLPAAVGQLDKMQEFHYRAGQLQALPPEIAGWKSLELLELPLCHLNTLPPEVGMLNRLQRINLNGNQLTTLPPTLAKLYNLKDLRLENNQLDTLPAVIGQLGSLTTLDISSN
ncbi:MAG: leucine-rich repeat domain-containing protein, partial [Sphingobacteriia bacterium]